MKLFEIKKQIISNFTKFQPEKVILFGSLTRHDWDEESDIDVIVVYNTDKPFFERLEELYLNWEMPTMAVDILAYTPSEFNDMYANSYFLKDVVDSGEIIYERS